MTVDTYTTAIDKIHAPELSVERAIKAAKARAAARASAQLKTRYTAAAASIALATAGGMMFYLFGKEQPPVSPSTVITATENNTESAESAETKPAQSKTEAATSAEKSTETQAATSETAAETRSVTEPTTAERQPETQKRAETPSPTEAQAPTQKADPPTEQPKPEEIIANIDTSKLCGDGKLYFMIAETGLSQIEDPNAFSDDKVIYIETKWGEPIVIKPFTINPEDHLFENPVPGTGLNPQMNSTSCYFYNSMGEILWTEPY